MARNFRADILAGKTPTEYIGSMMPDRNDPRFAYRSRPGQVYQPEKDRVNAEYQAAKDAVLMRAAAGDFTGGGKDNPLYGKRGVAAPYIEELANMGYTGQNIFQAINKSGLKSFNSPNDVARVQEILEATYDRPLIEEEEEDIVSKKPKPDKEIVPIDKEPDEFTVATLDRASNFMDGPTFGDTSSTERIEAQNLLDNYVDSIVRGKIGSKLRDPIA